MAKKKKSRKRRPQPAATKARPGGPGGATAQAAPERRDTAPPRDDRRLAARERREEAVRRRERQRRRQQLRVVAIVVAVALALAGFIAFRVVGGRREAASFRRIASAAGCTEVKRTSDSGTQQHLAEGETTTYAESPPTHGKHAGGSGVPAGFYPDPLPTAPAQGATIYNAVHSLEHGYVIAWFNGLTEAEQEAMRQAVADQRKVIAVSYPELEGGKLALTAWARTMTCAKPDPKVVLAFADRFREATAPEPNAP